MLNRLDAAKAEQAILAHLGLRLALCSGKAQTAQTHSEAGRIPAAAAVEQPRPNGIWRGSWVEADLPVVDHLVSA